MSKGLNFIKKYSSVYISGIGGIGISSIARLFNSQNIQVTGSDLTKTKLTSSLESEGINVFYEQSSEHIPSDIDLFIYSSAVPETSDERQYVKKHNIPSYSYPEFLGLISKHYTTIAISGTNGKTTTTAMVGKLFVDSGFDPLVIVGSIVPEWGSNIHIGNSDILIVESCEHRAHMLNIDADYIIISNIEEDHLDYYRDIDHIVDTFQAFVDKNIEKNNARIIINNDDPYSKKLEIPDENKTTFSITQDAQSDYFVENIVLKDMKQFFYFKNPVTKRNQEYVLQVPGRFNISNATSALVCSYFFDVKYAAIKKSLFKFTGTWRRFQRVGYYKDSLIISDYAHHPTAVGATLSAAREFLERKTVMVIFQPHHHNRTKELFSGFVSVLSDTIVDFLAIIEIFDVAGREEDHDQHISSKDLVKQVKKTRQCDYLPSIQEIKSYIDATKVPLDAILFIGAGDSYIIAEDLVESNQ